MINRLIIDIALPLRAFSDLLGKFLVPMKLGKNCVILGKKYDNLGKNCAFFNKVGKVYLLNSDFSANWECSRSIGTFSANWEKVWYRKPDPVLYREKALPQNALPQNKSQPTYIT